MCFFYHEGREEIEAYITRILINDQVFLLHYLHALHGKEINCEHDKL